jgi:hypothetical protein
MRTTSLAFAATYLAFSSVSSAQSISGLGALYESASGTYGGSYAIDMTSDGSTVVGWSGRSGATTSGFRWRRGIGIENVAPNAGTSAAGVSEDGQSICGTFNANVGYDSARAIVYSAGGPSLILDPLSGGSFSWGMDMSADGRVAVGYSGSSNGTRGWKRLSDGTMESLEPAAGGSHSWTTGISPDGATAAGYMMNSAGMTVPLRWFGSTPEQLPLGSALTGRVENLGWDGTCFGVADNLAALWQADGTLRTFQPMIGQQYGYARGIGTGFVAGTALFGTLWRAVVWMESGAVMTLQDYASSIGVDLRGWELANVQRVSADGRLILGHGRHEYRPGFFRDEAYILEVPAPASCSAIALMAVASRRRDRRVASLLG